MKDKVRTEKKKKKKKKKKKPGHSLVGRRRGVSSVSSSTEDREIGRKNVEVAKMVVRDREKGEGEKRSAET